MWFVFSSLDQVDSEADTAAVNFWITGCRNIVLRAPLFHLRLLVAHGLDALVEAAVAGALAAPGAQDLAQFGEPSAQARLLSEFPAEPSRSLACLHTLAAAGWTAQTHVLPRVAAEAPAAWAQLLDAAPPLCVELLLRAWADAPPAAMAVLFAGDDGSRQAALIARRQAWRAGFRTTLFADVWRLMP